jgi:cell division protein FtsZ
MVQLNPQYGRENEASPALTIKVIGVGGAGSNILDRAMLDGIEEVELIAANTDVQSLTASVASQKIQLGRNLTRGLGTGGDPELGLAAGREASEDLQSALSGGNIIFVCAGLGGGTGSGAAPFIVKLAKETNALVLVLVAMPFSFEGRRRCDQAATSLQLIRQCADAVVCFENDRMAEITLPRMGIHEAFAAADLTISQSIRAIADLLHKPGLLSLGFDEVCSVLRDGNARALFGFGEAEGENRAHDALAKALRNPLMHRGEMLANSANVIVRICGAANVSLGEVSMLMEELNRHINDGTQLMLGIGIDPSMGQKISVSILSSLGDASERPQPVIPSGTPQNPQPVGPLVEAHSQVTKPVPEPEPQSAPQEEPPGPVLTIPPRPPQNEAKPVKTDPPAQSEPKNLEPKQEVLQFESVSRGRFEKSEPTIIDGQDLDVPTFLRRHIKGK